MALNLDAVGRKIGPFTRSYDWKDLALYGLGVGAGFDELDYCYEKRLRVIPTFGAAMTFEVVWRLAALINLNVDGVLHGEHEMLFHHPIPPAGALITDGAIAHCYDKGRKKGALAVIELETRHSNGRKIFSSRAAMFARLDGGFGGEDAPNRAPYFPDRAADCEVYAVPLRDQPLVYRLSGDTFPLHVDQDFAKAGGFEGPVMHGLCTLGFACRALIARQCPGAPERVRRIGCRFKRPLYPGTAIKTLIWFTGGGQALWRVVKASDEAVVIDNGAFEYGKPERM
jgi:acyl dehydratase